MELGHVHVRGHVKGSIRQEEREGIGGCEEEGGGEVAHILWGHIHVLYLTKNPS